MVGAALRFDGGYLGFERCEDGNGEQYLRAVVYIGSIGRQASAAIDTDRAVKFARDVLVQAALAKGLDKDKLVDIALEQMVNEIRSEQTRI